MLLQPATSGSSIQISLILLGWAVFVMRRGTRSALLLLACSSSCLAFDDARCKSYAAQGFCTVPEKAAYMHRYCTENCKHFEEDESCEWWAKNGYCQNDDYKDYMSKTCPLSCGKKATVTR